MGSLRSGLLREIVTMSIDTLRTSKMRSALTVLGVVIGITSIVGMTSLIRGLRRVAARFDPRAWSQHDLRGEVQRHSASCPARTSSSC